jgi:hypothetical protein
MSILSDEDIITMLQIEVLLKEDATDTPFRRAMLKKYNALRSWADDQDILRMQELGLAVPIKPRFSKCTKCKKSQISVDLICNHCYNLTLQLLEAKR